MPDTATEDIFSVGRSPSNSRTSLPATRALLQSMEGLDSAGTTNKSCIHNFAQQGFAQSPFTRISYLGGDMSQEYPSSLQKNLHPQRFVLLSMIMYSCKSSCYIALTVVVPLYDCGVKTDGMTLLSCNVPSHGFPCFRGTGVTSV